MISTACEFGDSYQIKPRRQRKGMHTVPPYLLCQHPTFEKMNFIYFHRFYQVFSRKNATFQQNFITGIGLYYLALGLTIFSSFRANKNIFAWLRHVIIIFSYASLLLYVYMIEPGLIASLDS